jgi:ATP-dependent helicase YprA (DUF1998 family)
MSSSCDRQNQVLKAARAATPKYSAETTRTGIVKAFSNSFGGKDPYDWQVDVCEALLLGVNCIVIAGTGAGKTMPFVMPLLVDETGRKIVIILSPLNELEHDQVSSYQSVIPIFPVAIYHLKRLNGSRPWVSLQLQ